MLVIGHGQRTGCTEEQAVQSPLTVFWWRVSTR